MHIDDQTLTFCCRVRRTWLAHGNNCFCY